MSPKHRLRRARKLRGWTLDDLADRMHQGEDGPALGVDAHMIGRWERGVRSPQPRYVRILCKVFELSADQLGLVEEEHEPAAADTREDMRRRQMLQLLAALSTGQVDLTVLLAPRPDANLVRDLSGLTEQYTRLRETTAVEVLQPAVVGHLARLRQHASQSLTEGVRRQLGEVLAQTAILAGRNAFTMANPGDAASFYRCAGEAAREAGNRTLEAEVLVLRSILRRSALLGGADEPAQALRLAEAAWERVAGTFDPGFQAYVLAMRGEQRASVGDAAGSARDLDQVGELMTLSGGFPDAPRAPRDLSDLDAIRGVSLTLLGQPGQALPLLERVQRTMTARGNTSWLGTALTDRGHALGALGELEGAAQALAEAFRLGTEHGHKHNLVRVRGVRRTLPQSAALRELDELLVGAW